MNSVRKVYAYICMYVCMYIYMYRLDRSEGVRRNGYAPIDVLSIDVHTHIYVFFFVGRCLSGCRRVTAGLHTEISSVYVSSSWCGGGGDHQ